MEGYTFKDTATRNLKGVENLLGEKIYQGKLEPGTTVEKVIQFFSLYNPPGIYSWNDLYKFIRDTYRKRIYEPTDEELLDSYDVLNVQAIGDPVAQLKEVSQGIWTGFVDKLKTVIHEGVTWIQDEVLEFDPERFGKVYDKLIEMGMMDQESKRGILSLLGTFKTGARFLGAFVVLGLIKTFIGTFIAATGGTLVKKLNAEHTPNSPAPEAVLRAAFLHPELQGQVRRVMAENGLDKRDQDLMFAANYAILDLQTVKELRLRGMITDADVKKYLDDMGFTPERQKLIVQLFEMLIPIQDVATWMSKEAFEEGQIAIMGLDKELPQLFIDYAAKHGINKEDARRYWVAHWMQPGLDLMYRALHRRLITPEQLQTHMRTLEIPPYLRQVMTDIAYTPLTRVDIRRMYEDGVISLDETYDAYRDHGYNHENAMLMTEWTQRYAEPNEKELTKVQIVNLYIDGQITRPDTILMLQKIGYPEHRAELVVVYAEFEETKDLQNAQLENIELLYKDNWIDAAAARSQMGLIDLSPERISLLIQKWDIVKSVPTKKPSKTDFDKFLRNKIIDENRYNSEMKKLGYNDTYIRWYRELITAGGE